MNKIHRIAIVGPECSGKTTLSQLLADYFREPWVPEYAREYLADKSNYIEHDLQHIARGQHNAEQSMISKSQKFLFCDTNGLVVLIWSLVKYGHIHPDLLKWYQPKLYALHLLCKPDIPWEYDPLRENPMDRDRLFEVYESFLRDHNIPYFVIKGQERALSAKEYLKISF